MGFRDLREFIQAVEGIGELRLVRGADSDMEVGAITEVAASSAGCPMLIFDEIKGLQPGYRVVTNLLHTRPRLALALGQPPDSTGTGLLKRWKELSQGIEAPLPPVVVRDGPVRECTARGKEIDLLKFPAVKWHEYDAGRYFAGPAVVLRDPDGGWVNVGVYRLQVINRSTLLLSIAPGKHGKTILPKYWRKGKACPVAVSMGHTPAMFMAASLPVPWGISEYDFAGHINGAPIEVLLGEVTGLPVPAGAEVVLEGEVPPPETEGYIEGLWGEAAGFYASELPEKLPVIRVSSVMYRKEPIIQGAPPLKPLPGMQHFPVNFRCARLWTELERCGITGIRGVWQHAYGLLAISLKQSYAGHAKQAALIAAGSKSSLSVRFIAVVDDDVDPTSLPDVVWAMGTCCDPYRDVETVAECPADRTDPMVSGTQRGGEDLTTAKIIVNATKPVYRNPSFPRVNALGAEWKARVMERWWPAIK